MFSATSLRAAPSFKRAFSSSASRAHDLAKLTLIGRLGKVPETRETKNGKEYVHYSVATTRYPPPPPDADGVRPPTETTWHSIFSFSPSSNEYLKTLTKGSHVYVEANFELREADNSQEGEASSGQKQIFLRHESIRVLKKAPEASSE